MPEWREPAEALPEGDISAGDDRGFVAQQLVTYVTAVLAQLPLGDDEVRQISVPGDVDLTDEAFIELKHRLSAMLVGAERQAGREITLRGSRYAVDELVSYVEASLQAEPLQPGGEREFRVGMHIDALPKLAGALNGHLASHWPGLFAEHLMHEPVVIVYNESTESDE